VNHFHVTIDGESGAKPRKRGALATTRNAAEFEKRIEEAVPGRKVDIEECSQNCWASSPLIQQQH
jgi:hypothetical protein